MMSNVWGGCYHCYLVDAAAAFLEVPPTAASALNLELQAVTAGVVAADGGDAVAGHYQPLCNKHTVTVHLNTKLTKILHEGSSTPTLLRIGITATGH
jgi:hypothetical protein